MSHRSPLSLTLAFLLGGTTACAHLGEKEPERQAFDPTSCHAGTFDVYFRPAQVNLSPEAKAQIDAMQRAISGCKIEKIAVVGLPDMTGDPRTEQKMSHARADAIVAKLESTGVSGNKLRVLTRSIKGTAERNGAIDLMQRRALITVLASPS